MSSVPSRRRRDVKDEAEEKKVVKLALHEQLQENDLIKIYSAFKKIGTQQMNERQLKELLETIDNISYSEEEFFILFKKMSIKGDGYVTWDDFISHLILGFEEKEVMTEYQSLTAPISGTPRILRSNHRHPVNRIIYCPTVKPDRTWTWSDGSILTCSKDGIINYWSLNMELERTVQSTCPELKVQQTWVLDIVALPDVSVVCTCSSERDLRFYDTSARKFELRIMITSVEDAVCCMYYRFSSKFTSMSKLILGDMSGSIRILMFSPKERGPFKSQPGIPLLSVRYEQVRQGRVNGFHIVEFKHLHSDWVRQVDYYPSLHCFMSCSSCQRAPLIMKDISENRCSYNYKIPKGVWCFAFLDSIHLLATGSPDCLVRIWNPFVPDRPTVILTGHHASITALILQVGGKVLASMSKDKCIKVWDLSSYTCLQTYLDLPSEIGERTDLTYFYNPRSREIIIGSVMIVVIFLCKLQSSEHTDGTTHSSGVSVVLYNSLFKVVVTCGLDSFIIVWDPWNGRRMRVMKEAHTRLLHGEVIPVEITAACFDPGNQLLLTGAHDGSLRVWNFNTGTCLRNLQIESGCEISAVVWIKGRIMAIGWNKHVTEFADSGGMAGPGQANAKAWDTRHTEDVLCCAVRAGQSLATASYNGELILWRLETGQPYKQFNVSQPTARIKIQYKPMAKKETRTSGTDALSKLRRTRQVSVYSRKLSSGSKISQSRMSTSMLGSTYNQKFVSDAKSRKVSTVPLPESCIPVRGIAVNCMIFLQSREMHPQIGTLMVALENGTVQVWSHHASGSFITSFSAIHKAGDYVIAMETDAKNIFLFTGTSHGYIKTWLMKNYCVLEEDKEHICMPKLRLTFPFLWKETFTGRAKRMIREQPLPLLLSSFQAHLFSVTDMVYINEAKILISSSTDCSTRMWTLGGRYLQTIGTFKPWKDLEIETPPKENFQFTIPPEIKRVASSTTFKVLMGGMVEKRIGSKKQVEMEEKKEQIKTEHIKSLVYGKKLEYPILGNYYSLPERTAQAHIIELDTTFSHIPVYQNLIMPPPVYFPHPSTPQAILNVREEATKPAPTAELTRGNSKGSLKSKFSIRSMSSKVSFAHL